MKKKLHYWWLWAASALMVVFCCGCKKESTQPAEIVRLDTALAVYPQLSESEKDELISENKDAIEALMAMAGFSEVSDSALQAYSQSKAVTVFTPDVAQRLTSIDSIEQVLSVVRSRMSAELPSVDFPKLYGAVIPYKQSIVLVDSMLFVGLNHYLGADYPGYEYFEPYQRSVKTRANLAPDIVEALLVTAYPYAEPTDGSSTLLSRMLYEGAIAEAKKQLLPKATDALILGYDKNQIDWLKTNEQRAWNALVSRQLLYSVDPMVAERLINPAPSATLLNPDAPGRPGRFIGYRIVESYIKNNPDNSGLEFLLSPEFYNSSDALLKSKYTGK